MPQGFVGQMLQPFRGKPVAIAQPEQLTATAP
jgi:hypothetical protein